MSYQEFGLLAEEAYRPLGALIEKDRWKDKLTEVTINGDGDIWMRVAGKGYVKVPGHEAGFCTFNWLDNLCRYFAASVRVRWAEDLPILACRTPVGDRFIGITGANVESRMACSIRRKRMVKASYDDFEVKPEWRDLIDENVESGRNIGLSGGTGSGKTTFMNMLIGKIPLDRRILTAEDTRELIVPHLNRVHFIVSRTEASTRITYAHIIDAVLRLNPHIFLMGELSIANAFYLVQALDTGHEGAMTTGHANSCLDFLRGVRRRVALGGGNVATEVQSLMEFLMENLHLVMQIKHLESADNTERRVVNECVRPKDLLDRKDTRENFIERERHVDKVFDVARARDALLASNAGDPLSNTQREVLRTLGILFGPSSGDWWGNPQARAAGAALFGGADTGTLSPEDQMELAVRQNPHLSLGGEPPPGDEGLNAEVHGDGAEQMSFRAATRKFNTPRHKGAADV